MEKFALWSDKKQMKNLHAPVEQENVLDEPCITYYPPVRKETDMAVVIFPGGGYSMRSDAEGRGYAQFLNAHRITAFVVDYRVLPHRFPLPLCDAMRSVRFVRHFADRFGISAQKVAVMGSSAGGHLAALLSTWTDDSLYERTDAVDLEEYHPDLQILAYPVISFTDLNIADMESVLNFIEPKELFHASRFDPSCLADDNTPPAFIWHTADDDNVNVKNSLTYAHRLTDHDISVELHIFPHGLHGLGLAESNPSVHQWCGLLLNWLRSFY